MTESESIKDKIEQIKVAKYLVLIYRRPKIEVLQDVEIDVREDKRKKEDNMYLYIKKKNKERKIPMYELMHFIKSSSDHFIKFYGDEGEKLSNILFDDIKKYADNRDSKGKIIPIHYLVDDIIEIVRVKVKKELDKYVKLIG